MCGIAGYLDWKNPIDRDRFDKMVDIIDYRGPDDRGTYYDGYLALGHRRLAIIDLSKEGHQPFLYNDRYVLVFNGEIYNYKELQVELEKKGYYFTTKTDTEVLIAAYDCYGRDCVRHFNGMWSFAIYDKKNQELYCSRDRFGVKPFYYYVDDDRFIFGSEIKQILLMYKEQPKANIGKLYEFLVCGDLDYSEETMFQDIKQLVGGCELIFSLSSHEMSIRQYYDLSAVGERKLSYSEECQNFRRTFDNSVNLRLRADVPLGYCLSGGLDSSSIACMSDKLITQSNENVEQHAVSSCFLEKEYDEQEYIDEVIRSTSIHSHKFFPQEKGLFDELDSILWHMDEPFGSTSIYAQWNVFREAQKIGLTVMLDGQGADEQLAGYSSFYSVRFADLAKHFRFVTLYREISSYLRIRAKTESYISAHNIIFSSLISAFLPRIVWNYIYYIKCMIVGIPFPKKILRRVLLRRKLYPLNDEKRYINDSMKCGMQALLHYEDRDSMAFSIESRVPFLDYSLVENIHAMPFHYKIRNGVTKSVLRDGLEDILPEKIRTRYSKLGFVTPEDQWIKENYTEFREVLSKSCDSLSPLLAPEEVLNWFDKNNQSIQRGDFLAWRIICAGRWINLFHVKV